jgi:hypothetical protein
VVNEHGGHGELLVALERLLNLFEQPRKKSPVEALPQNTSAYLKLMAAYGFARLGASERASTIAREGFGQLTGRLHDPIHASLTAAFEARITMAIDGRSRYAQLPDALLAQRAGLDRVTSYKVLRVWEVSWILSPGFDREDAIGTFSRRVSRDRPPVVFALDAPPEVRAARIADHLESSCALDRDPGIARIASCLDGLAELPEVHAMPILTRAVQLIDTLPDPPIELRIAVLLLIAQFGWGELVPMMFDPFAAQLATIPPERLGYPLLATLQALRRLDLRDAMGRVVATLEPLLESWAAMPNTNLQPAASRLMIGGAMSFLDDPQGHQLLQQARRKLEQAMTLTSRLALTRMIANSYALASIPSAIAGIESLHALQWREITDSFGTNSHFCLAALDFADSLIVGLIEARLGRGAA